MAVLVTDPLLEERLRLEREQSGADRYDEVWKGVYVMVPMPNDEHQQLVTAIGAILQEAVGWPGLAEVRAGVNLSDRREDWTSNYRVPDVAVFLKSGAAENCGTHWLGAADFLVEITSPEDRTREKLHFYQQIGVVELLVVDRDPWAVALYRRQEGTLREVGRSSLPSSEVLVGQTVGLRFQLVSATPRPQIEVTHAESGRRWLV